MRKSALFMYSRRCVAARRRRYDHIVVGAGSSGCVTATRLAERGSRVLLLEAGPPDSSPLWRVPFLSALGGQTDNRSWHHISEPEPGLANRRISQSHGRLLGGSSCINEMIWARGHPKDYDEWAQLAQDPSWSYDGLLPFFKRSEEDTTGGDRAFRGLDGPVTVSLPQWKHPLSEVFLQACVEQGYSMNSDFNAGDNTVGVGFHQVTQSEGKRVSSSGAYLQPALRSAGPDGARLEVISGAHVQRVKFDGRHAIGVEWEGGSACAGEIVLSSGVFNSPKLLLQSGIGPRSQLESHGIEVVHDLPGVGTNLQDHLEVPMPLAKTWGTSFGDFLAGSISGSGPLSTIGVDSGGYIKSDESIEREDLQLRFSPWSFLDRVASLGACLSRPQSRGAVELRSADIRDPLRIRFNFLAEEQDKLTLVNAVRRLRQILDSSAFHRFRDDKAGCLAFESDSEILDFLGRTCRSAQHAVGTCAMGVDDMAVVDGQLRVHGVQGLRVVDASIIPSIVTSNTHSSVIAIALKAASMMTEKVASNSVTELPHLHPAIAGVQVQPLHNYA